MPYVVREGVLAQALRADRQNSSLRLRLRRRRLSLHPFLEGNVSCLRDLIVSKASAVRGGGIEKDLRVEGAETELRDT